MFVCPVPKISQVMMKWCRRASHLSRFTLWNNGRCQASHLCRFTLWNNSRRATQLGRFTLWHYSRLATQLSRLTLWHSRRWASQLAGKFTLWHNKQPGLMLAPGVARIFRRNIWRLNPKKNFTQGVNFQHTFERWHFGRCIKHRSIVDLQRTLKYVRFTKIQQTFKRCLIYEDRIADLSRRLKDECRGHTNHHVS